MGAITLGIVGFGVMGERLAGAALSHPDIRIAGGWDPSPRAAARWREVTGAAPFLPDADAVIEACDVLYIAAPPAAHIPLARRAFKAGKAVFLEKPLATDLDEAAAFVAEAEEGRARAAVNFPMASSPAVEQVSRWRQDGHVGAPLRLDIVTDFARWPRHWQAAAAPWLARRQEGGFTREVLSHFLFLALRQLGPLAVVSAAVAYGDDDAAETAMAAELRAGEIPLSVSGTVGRIAEDEQHSWTLSGEAGAIRLRNWSLAERLQDGNWQPAAEALSNAEMRPLVLQRQLSKLRALVEGKPQDLATLREAFEVQAIVERILRNGAM
ncbi:Gfo/Idh/MocA family protein [Teichococcus aerofrigidensis]